MRNLLYLLIGLVVGVGATMLFAPKTPQLLKFEEKVSRYGFDETVQMLEESAKQHQWRLPAVHDMQKTMASIGKEVKSARIYELCKPEFAYEVVGFDQNRLLTSMLPCRVAVYEKNDGVTYISFMDLEYISQSMTGNIPETMKTVQAEINKLVEGVVE